MERLLQSIQGQRQRTVDKEGSPYFDLYLGVIAAGVKENYDIGEYAGLSEARKYLPLDYIQIVNNDAVPLELGIKAQRFYIAPGAIFSVDNEAIWGFTIKNLDASVSTTANKIHIVLQRQAIDENKMLRRKL